MFQLLSKFFLYLFSSLKFMNYDGVVFFDSIEARTESLRSSGNPSIRT